MSHSTSFFGFLPFLQGMFFIEESKNPLVLFKSACLARFVKLTNLGSVQCCRAAIVMGFKQIQILELASQANIFSSQCCVSLFSLLPKASVSVSSAFTWLV